MEGRLVRKFGYSPVLILQIDGSLWVRIALLLDAEPFGIMASQHKIGTEEGG